MWLIPNIIAETTKSLEEMAEKYENDKNSIGVLISAYRRYYGNSWYMNGSNVNGLGYLLCGFPPCDLQKITPTIMKELNSDVLGKLHQCNEAQVKTLYDIAVHPDAYENNTSYTLTQINGQRIYRKAPHAWSGPEPSRNCEVFIGRIPHDCFEDTLVPLFRQAGELFEFRLMINFSGWNRGYAFAMYTNDAEASNAIRMFNNYMIRPSWQLGVCPSINNCRIFISRIPPTLSSAEIVRLLYELTDEVQEVRVRRSIASSAAIVEYKSHRGAAMARKALVAAAAAAWGCGARPAVDWSLPQSPQLLKQWNGRGMESLMSSMASLSLLGGALGAGERAVWAPPGPPAARPPPANDFNPWTARHPLQEFITPHNEHCPCRLT
ncbi:hypothetical protein MSG28_004300 [Choristoneura fumiferana]|uniref:Uncharacterized protein n=1 Tax=Choristoneura fumiferana TaxID=7141 RepID=A0ACC0KIW7_CHOFU|nr:hypothetical protein MSG28_004300 [Choristoneura fumiferana]